MSIKERLTANGLSEDVFKEFKEMEAKIDLLTQQLINHENRIKKLEEILKIESPIRTN